MNAGRDYAKAKATAQANADSDGKPRWLHMYGFVWWIDRENPTQAEPPAEKIEPRKTSPDALAAKLTKQLAEMTDLSMRLLQCHQFGVVLMQHDGHRWMQWLDADESSNARAVDWYAEFEKADMLRPGKEYGSLFDLLDKVDATLVKLGRKNLKDSFLDEWGGEWKMAWGLDMATLKMMATPPPGEESDGQDKA